MSVAVGALLGVYQVLSPLGAGAMGEVYLARDTKLNRSVALKVLPEFLAGNAERLSRFRAEAQVLASLDHPNIAHIYGLEDWGALHGIVMEFVDGQTLDVLIDQKRAQLSGGLRWPANGTVLPPVEVTGILRQIAEALEAAHERGIVHRDLKPANVKLRHDGVVKVLDFGLAKVLTLDGLGAANGISSPTMTARGTQLGTVLGTAAYMAPEQARGKPVDRRADIWAFGVVGYELLTGERAFKGQGFADTIAAVLTQDVDWTKVPANASSSLVKLLRRCLERDPRRRLRDIGEARIALESFGASDGQEDGGTAPRTAAEGDPVSRPAEPLSWRSAARAAISPAVSIAVMSGCLLIGRNYVSSRPVGSRLESFEYSALQLALIPDAEAGATWRPNDPRLPIVVDISPIRTDKTQITDREKLDQLVDTLHAMNVSAIGIDVDFSPTDSGNFISQLDGMLLEKWREAGNVRVGVFRREGYLPDEWLGHPDFHGLAAGMMLPEADAGFAIQYSSPALSRAATPFGYDAYLLQMPAALYEIAHPGSRSGLVDDPRLARTIVDNQILLGRFPIDYSFLRQIVVIPYKDKGNLDLWAGMLQHRVVLVGDANDAGDTRCTQARPDPVAGVLIHASALATLNRGILRYVDEARGLTYDAYLCLMSLGIVWILRVALSRRAGLNAHIVDLLAFGAAGLASVVVGSLVIGLNRTFWPDPFWLALAFVMVPYIKDLSNGAVLAIRSVFSPSLPQRRPTHVS